MVVTGIGPSGGGAMKPPASSPVPLESDAVTVDPMTRIDILHEQGFRRLPVTFVNHIGLSLVKAVPMERAAVAAEQGLGFSPVSDAFGATGGIDPLQSLAVPDGDLRLKPDLASLAVLDRDLDWAWAAIEVGTTAT